MDWLLFLNIFVVVYSGVAVLARLLYSGRTKDVWSAYSQLVIFASSTAFLFSYSY